MESCRKLLLLALIFCSSANAQGHKQNLQKQGLAIHAFRVDVTFSEKAKKKLIDSGETVITIAYLTGSPKVGVPFKLYKQYASRPGPLGLGENEIEVFPGDAVSFSNLKLKQGALSMIDDQGPQLLVNVVSGRKSSQDNLLDCGIYEGSLKAVEGNSIPIYCKLIRGE